MIGFLLSFVVTLPRQLGSERRSLSLDKPAKKLTEEGTSPSSRTGKIEIPSQEVKAV
ncbi:hypothetical protein GWK48_09035 [Metallosphaera tengchongensis]|uniref:Uncharacterized protein n=1 Tax=Metallosphaera tengchongensis TaxID=1532350 RepID=A0A6N0NUL7_9CREN|nr:hypothetical protein [Metallosphaera tengchongensis]QKR00496.1 hypothetical protein GWK48_09035 [Metallosphaera tengchongensis]